MNMFAAPPPGVTKGVSKKEKKGRKRKGERKKRGKKGKKKRQERGKWIEKSINMTRGVPLV